MEEATKRRWDVIIGVFGPIFTVLGLLAGVWQFNVGENNRRELQHVAAVEKDQLDFRRRLWLERVDAYRKIAEVVGRVVAHADDDKLPDMLKEFIAAYWGMMILVEDKDVERAMIAFFVETHDLLETHDSQNKQNIAQRLKIRADELLTACRNSEAKGQVELGGGKTN
jgi:hypothetical protein